MLKLIFLPLNPGIGCDAPPTPPNTTTIAAMNKKDETTEFGKEVSYSCPYNSWWRDPETAEFRSSFLVRTIYKKITKQP